MLRLVVAARHRQIVLDDLQEGFARRLASQGAAAAVTWYRREARRCVAPALRMRLHDLAPGAGLARVSTALVQAARRLAATPSFSLTAIATLGLTLGVAATLFTLVDAVLLRPLPYASPSELFYLGHRTVQDGEVVEMPLSSPTAFAYRQAEAVTGLGLWFEAAGNLTDGEAPERIAIAMVSTDLLDVLRVPVALGRGFVREDAAADPIRTILLSHDLWVRRYGADGDIVGTMVEFNGRDREVVGVLPAHLRFPRARVDAWMPSFAEPGAGLGNFDLQGVARLAPGTSLERAAAELETLSAGMVAAFPTFEEMQMRARLTPLHERVVGEWETFLRMLVVVGGLVLGVAVANVGGLLLVRAGHQAQELAVRAALGASASSRFGFHLAEAILLCGAATLVALALAIEGVPLLVASVPTDVPRLDEAALAGRTLFATVGAGLALATLLALVVSGRPRLDPSSAVLRGSGGPLSDPRAAFWRQAILAGQLAVAVALITVSALLVRSAMERQKVDLGFHPDGVITAQVPLSYRAYPAYSDASAFWNSLLERLRALPGVVSAGAVDSLPLADGATRIPLELMGATPASGVQPPMFPVRLATPGFFEALGVTMLEGRFPDEGDADLRPVVVSESLAATLRLEPGARIRWARPDAEWSTVVGVVSDIRDRAPDAEPDAVLYAPVLGQQSFSVFVPRVMTLVVRTDGEPPRVAPALRSTVNAIDPLLPVTRVRPMREWVVESTAAATFATATLAAAAAVAALLGAVGLYGVVAYLVGRRRSEIGVRLALGAVPARVAAQVVAGSLGSAALGLLLGGLLAAAGTRMAASWMFAVSPLDPAALAATAAALGGIVGVATWAPARRALRVDPASALRG